MTDDREPIAETRLARAATLHRFFAAVASGDAEAAYSQMSSVFRLLFTLPTFRQHLEQDASLRGYLRLEVGEERVERQPTDLALLDLANFGDTTPDDDWQAEETFAEYLACLHVAVRGVAELTGGRRARFQAALLLEQAGWRVKGYQVEEA